MNQDYIGIVVEEALDDNCLINKLNVQKVRITHHRKKEDRWHMYEVKVSLDEINNLSSHIVNDWYIHFWKGSDIIALFGNSKKFEFNYNCKESWKDVLEYGRSIGIIEEQLDFPIKGLK